MSKKYLLILTLFLYSNLVVGQSSKENQLNEFNIGINVGPNHNSLRGDAFADKYDAQFNYFVGLTFEYCINENFSVLTNLNYENKSHKSEYSGYYQVWVNTFDIEDKTKFKNLNIPLLLKYKFGFEKEFYVNGGLFYNHIFDVSNEMINTETGEDLSVFDYNELLKNKDYGISLGIGMTIKLNDKNNLSLEIRDDFGISDIAETNYSSISKIHTNTIKLIANWSLNL